MREFVQNGLEGVDAGFLQLMKSLQLDMAGIRQVTQEYAEFLKRKTLDVLRKLETTKQASCCCFITNEQVEAAARIGYILEHGSEGEICFLAPDEEGNFSRICACLKCRCDKKEVKLSSFSMKKLVFLLCDYKYRGRFRSESPPGMPSPKAEIALPADSEDNLVEDQAEDVGQGRPLGVLPQSEAEEIAAQYIRKFHEHIFRRGQLQNVDIMLHLDEKKILTRTDSDLCNTILSRLRVPGR